MGVTSASEEESVRGECELGLCQVSAVTLGTVRYPSQAGGHRCAGARVLGAGQTTAAIGEVSPPVQVETAVAREGKEESVRGECELGSCQVSAVTLGTVRSPSQAGGHRGAGARVLSAGQTTAAIGEVSPPCAGRDRSSERGEGGECEG